MATPPDTERSRVSAPVVEPAQDGHLVKRQIERVVKIDAWPRLAHGEGRQCDGAWAPHEVAGKIDSYAHEPKLAPLVRRCLPLPRNAERVEGAVAGDQAAPLKLRLRSQHAVKGIAVRHGK